LFATLFFLLILYGLFGSYGNLVNVDVERCFILFFQLAFAFIGNIAV
jgi:hypothetical protein